MMLTHIDRELENFETLLQPALESKPRTPFDSPDLPAASKFADMTRRQALSVIPLMGPLIQNYGCAICLVQCPFSQVGYDQIKTRFKGNPHAPQFQIPLEIQHHGQSETI
jgi:hypothetical protein